MSMNENEIGSTLNQCHTKTKHAEGVKGIITEYCNDSTVHGFKYVGDHNRPVIERIIWTFVLILSISTCCYFIISNWEKRSTNPVIITFDERITPVWEIPFPTVTICPETKTDPDIFNFTNFIYRHVTFNHNLTSEEDFFIDAVGQMCPETLPPFYVKKTEKTSNISDLLKAMTLLCPTFENIIFKSTWRESFESFERKDFHKVLTGEGPCYSFNSLDAKAVYREEALVEGTSFDDDNNKESEWTLDRGFNIKKAITHPLHAFSSGVREGLSFVLTGSPQNSDMLCQGHFQGFKLIISTPGEVPQISKQYLSIPFSSKVTVSIKPEIVYTSDGLHQHDPERRRCYFQHERYLKYFKVYTQANCELECLSNVTLEQCGCVKFHMPRTETVPVCGIKSVLCPLDMNKYLLSQEFNETQENRCNCLPTCSTMNYKAELEDLSPVDESAFWRSHRVPHIHSATQLTISFKEKAFNALRRSERYTFIDFIASCGGLLGLCMGVSILSLVELLSFLTIRLWVNLRIIKRKHLEMKKTHDANGSHLGSKLTD